MRPTRRFRDLVLMRLGASWPTRLALRTLALGGALGGLAPLIANELPYRLPDVAATSDLPLLWSTLGAGDLVGIGAGLALLVLSCAPRRGRHLALGLFVLGLVCAPFAEGRAGERPVDAEMEARERLADLDRGGADSDDYATLVEDMPLLVQLTIEIEERIGRLEGGRGIEDLVQTNEQALAAAAEGLWLPPVPHGPATPSSRRYRAPDSRHWAGTDGSGRDLLARMLYGARVSLGLAAVTTLIATLIGLVLGGIAGWRGGLWDLLVTRLTETATALPALLILVMATAYLPPSAGVRTTALVVLLAAVGWVLPARFVRAEIAALRRRDFIVAAEALGVGPVRLFVRHLVPNAATGLAVAATTLFGGVVVAEAGLSFLGLGIPDAPSWGQSLREARDGIALGDAWHLALFPGFAVLAVIVAVNHLGDALRDAGDPRSRDD